MLSGNRYAKCVAAESVCDLRWSVAETLCPGDWPAAGRWTWPPLPLWQSYAESNGMVWTMRCATDSSSTDRSELWAQRHEWRHDTAYAFVQEVFEQLDTDGSGTLSKSEVAGLKELVEKYVEKKRSSQNPEDMVTYEEFETKFQPGGECKPDTSRVFIELESTLGIAWA